MVKALGAERESEGIPLDERPDRIKALQSEVRTLEISEEDVITELADLGFQVERRPNASPEVILEWQG